MCKCTPTIRTPFCGRLGCEWPETKPGKRDGYNPAEEENINPILKYQRLIRPNLHSEPAFARLAFVLRYACVRPASRMVHVSEVCDALVELIPEQRELWLRADATDNEYFLKGMTAFFETEPTKED